MLTASAALLWAGLYNSTPAGKVEPAAGKAAKTLSPETILQRGASVARCVAADAGPLKLNAQMVLPDAGALDGHPIWDVGCADTVGRLRLRLEVDGVTGDVFHITRVSTRPLPTGPGQMDKDTATRAAARWLSVVEPLGKQGVMRPSGISRVRAGWLVKFDGPGVRTFAIVDSHSGALRWMTSSHSGYRTASLAMANKI